MSKKLSIKRMREIATENGYRQIIILAWDGKTTFVGTWGKSLDDCSQAADGGNLLKQKWGWPEHNDQPARVRKIQARVRELERILRAAGLLA